jgi:hypothetical protein
LISQETINMYHTVITNRGKAWLEEEADSPARLALAAVASPRLEANDPEAVFAAFCTRLGERLGAAPSPGACRALWQELAQAGMIKVRRPLPPGTPTAFTVSDPPVETYRPGWGGKRAGAGAKPRDPAGRPRVQRSVMLAPDVDEAVLAARHEVESFSDALDRLVREAIGRAP